jgi:carboxyl-terminal processing protease
MITEYLKNEKDNIVVVKRGEKELSFSVRMDDVYLTSTSHDIIESKNERIGYISLSSFTANSAADFQESLIELEKEGEIDSLIIDLRGNTGGYLSSAFNIASIFLEKGKVVYSLDNKDGKVSYKDETKQKMNIDVVVLVNQNSASASEVLAGALKDSYGATIVGMTTFGKGTVQTTKKHGDTMIKYTSAKWLRPNGECVDGVGIKPDYEIEIEIKNNTMYDKQLDKAIELLS